MQKIQSLEIKKKGKKFLMSVTYNVAEVGKEGTFDSEYRKKSNQWMSRDLEKAVSDLKPHLGFASEMADTSIKLNDEMDYETYWKDGHYMDDERFAYLEITKVQFVGTEVLDAVKIWGYRETQLTADPFRVNFETPVINLDRVAENRYALVKLLDEHCDSLLQEVELWLSKGKTLDKAQQIAMFEEQEAEG